MKIVLLTISLMLICVTTNAQQSTNINKNQPQAKPNNVTAPALTVVPAPAAPQDADIEKPVLILINELSPDQIIVFDVTGKWLDTVKSVDIKLDVGTGSIAATLTSWKGVLKPRTPKITKTKVKEIKSVTADEFNNKLEEINK